MDELSHSLSNTILTSSPSYLDFQQLAKPQLQQYPRTQLPAIFEPQIPAASRNQFPVTLRSRLPALFQDSISSNFRTTNSSNTAFQSTTSEPKTSTSVSRHNFQQVLSPDFSLHPYPQFLVTFEKNHDFHHILTHNFQQLCKRRVAKFQATPSNNFQTTIFGKYSEPQLPVTSEPRSLAISQPVTSSNF